VDQPDIAEALRKVTSALGAGEERPCQVAMAEAVARAIRQRRHLVVRAGTGTGKSMGYLVPAVALGARVVVATATKALQDQLAGRDLPLLVEQLDERLVFAVLKGRSNYLCRQRVSEIAGGGDQLPLTDPEQAPPPPGQFARELRRLAAWSATSTSGDRAELDWEPSPAAWAQVSVGSTDCPGAARCPSGADCFAEAARRRAGEADVVVVNTHLYATHLAAGGEILPPHDVVVFDEAHELEEVASASLGFEVGAGRFSALARSCRTLLADPSPALAVEEAGRLLASSLAPCAGRRLPRPLGTDLADRVVLARERVADLAGALRRRTAPSGGRNPDVEAGEDAAGARRARALQSAGHLLDDLDALVELPDSSLAWVDGPPHDLRLEVAPIDVGEALARLLWAGEGAPTGILTSATVPPGLAGRVGLPAGSLDELDVGSPFDYPTQALLYCALHLPDPRQAAFEAASVEELARLITAAGGRTLALFTSWRAMTAAAERLRPRLPWPILAQGDLPKAALVERFSTEEHSCLFATLGFWQGVDVPGAALSLVTIDRLPFPRPDDPLLQARRERLGTAAFAAIDLPRAATLLAQGAGRLIRSASDRGVVAVLDRRLGTARYRWTLVAALPPMRRTRRFADVEDFFARLRPG